MLSSFCAILCLTGCATKPLPTRETLTISRGACFGFCPVYRIDVSNAGAATFTGLRHSAFLGSKSHYPRPELITEIFAQLEPYRPAAASSIFACTSVASDQSEYIVTWSGNGKRENVSMSFNSGCSSEEGARLLKILRAVPQSLGFGSDAEQITRPGVSRG